MTDIQWILHSCRKETISINHTATISINYTTPLRAYGRVAFVFTSRSQYCSYIKMNGLSSPHVGLLAVVVVDVLTGS
jgi:hypothetical protein